MYGLASQIELIETLSLCKLQQARPQKGLRSAQAWSSPRHVVLVAAVRANMLEYMSCPCIIMSARHLLPNPMPRLSTSC